DAHTVVARDVPARLGPPQHFSSAHPATARSRNSLWSIPRAGKSVLDNRIVSASQYDARDLLRGCHRVHLLRSARDGARQITYLVARDRQNLLPGAPRFVCPQVRVGNLEQQFPLPATV